MDELRRIVTGHDGEGKAVWCEFTVPAVDAEQAEGASQALTETGDPDLEIEELLAMTRRADRIRVEEREQVDRLRRYKLLHRLKGCPQSDCLPTLYIDLFQLIFPRLKLPAPGAPLPYARRAVAPAHAPTRALPIASPARPWCGTSRSRDVASPPPCHAPGSAGW